MADNASHGLARALGWISTPEGQAALAGALGGVVRTLTLRSDWREGIANLAVGGICAAYLHPLVLPILFPTLGKLGLEDAQIVGLSGLLMGIGGMTFVGFILDVIKARRAATGGDK